jgi:hypothetical protein
MTESTPTPTSVAPASAGGVASDERTTALVDILELSDDGILDDAVAALERSHETHYEAAGADVARARLATMLGLIRTCIDTHDLMPMIDHATLVADERFEAGFDIREVQRAFHVLEEAIWDRVIASTPPDRLAQALGMVGTVLGAGRDALARTYVSRASRHHVSTLDLSALFRGGR